MPKLNQSNVTKDRLTVGMDKIGLFIFKTYVKRVILLIDYYLFLYN